MQHILEIEKGTIQRVLGLGMGKAITLALSCVAVAGRACIKLQNTVVKGKKKIARQSPETAAAGRQSKESAKSGTIYKRKRTRDPEADKTWDGVRNREK